jgi:putative transposase
MVTAAPRRRAVDHLKSRRFSERRACRLIGLSCSAAWYRLRGRDDSGLRERLKTLAEQYPRYGYSTLHEMLKTEGRVINRKRTYRLYREEGLQIRTKRRKKLARSRIPRRVPDAVNERWSIDFMCDQLGLWPALADPQSRRRLYTRVYSSDRRLLNLRPAVGSSARSAHTASAPNDRLRQRT